MNVSWMIHAVLMNKSCHTYESCLTYRMRSHVSHTEWVTSHIRKIHDLVIHMCGTWLVQMMWLSDETWIFHMRDVTHSICETWLIILYVRHDSSLIHMCGTWLWVTSHIWKIHVVLMNKSWHTYDWVIVYVSHVTHTMSHGTHMIESLYTYKSFL